jgi:tetratricopeptide (TPR) repeat protein
MSKWIPDVERMLLMLEASDESDEIRVRLPDGRMASPNGQFLLDFSEHSRSNRDTGKGRVVAEFQFSNSEAADRWFAAGVLAEEGGRNEEAVEAYERALLAGGPQAETCFNLGNSFYALDRKSEAAQRYLQAVELDSEYVEAWNNLGNALAGLNKPEEAARAYETALRFEPRYADAHWNLAETCEQLSRMEDAKRHWQAYLEEDPHSRSAEAVRRHLAEFTP